MRDLASGDPTSELILLLPDSDMKEVLDSAFKVSYVSWQNTKQRG